MRTLQICLNPFPSLGGPAKTYQQFYDAVDARALAFLAPDDGMGEEAVVPLDLVVKTLGGKKIRGYYFAPDIGRHEVLAAIASADVVFLHGLFTHPTVWVARACRQHGVPYIVILHGILDPWALKKTRLAKAIWLMLFGRKILANAAAVVCATQREAVKAAPFLDRTARTKVVNWACEIPSVSKIVQGRAELRRRLGFSDSDRVLVYLGRLHSMKRPIETVRHIAESGIPDLKLLMIGPDDDVSGSMLESVARELNWSGLRVVGPVFGEGKFDYLRAGDGFISLSHRENFNYGLVEAMASGLAPILSPGNDLGWEFSGTGFTWQLESNDREELLRVLEEFRSLPIGQLRERGRLARDWTERNLSMRHLRQQLGDLIEVVVKPNPSSM
jgi:glycosyltransferase involved in cell wall biosynthesis